jgi:raffinose/stachyose/melibiose transport system permease protein
MNTKIQSFSHDKVFYWTFMGPGLLLYTVFFIAPVMASVAMSFADWSGFGPIQFAGFKNFIRMFRDIPYITSFLNTLMLIGYGLLVQIPMALLIAYLLFKTEQGTSTFRAIFFFPVVIAPIAIATMYKIFYNGEYGPINEALSSIGLASFRQNWLSNKNLVLHSVIIPEIWRFIGLHVVILLAALQGIPKSVIESSVIDGASPKIIFFRIVVPMIRHIILISVVLCITGSFKSFEFPLILTNGGPGESSTYLGLYMFRQAFTYQHLGYGSAITLSILAYAMVLTYLSRLFLGGARAEN